MTDQFNAHVRHELHLHTLAIKRVEDKLDKVLGAFEILLSSVPKKKNAKNTNQPKDRRVPSL